MAQDDHQSWYRENFKHNNSEPAQLEDYAFYLQALISLYDATQNTLWLQRAQHLFEVMRQQLWDAGKGGFYKTAIDNKAPYPFVTRSAFR